MTDPIRAFVPGTEVHIAVVADGMSPSELREKYLSGKHDKVIY